ncbi:MAG: LssY C-terminal domain-containing protein [Patescibacteria group bacterium]|nr:LssY C-terminal domain-containing protein [Patescibacteria group bacterium]
MTEQILNFLTELLPKIGHLGIFGYWLLLLITFLESIAFIGVLIPGAIIIALFGILASQNYFDFKDLIWYAAIGAVLGDILSFYLGRYANKIFKPNNRIFRSNYIKKGEVFFKNHGPKSIFLGRFIAFVRPNISFVAGLFKMDAKKFYFYNITSAFLWAILYLAIGYALAETATTIAFWSTRVSVLILVILAFLIIIDLLRYLIIKRGRVFFQFLKSILISLKEAVLQNPDVRKMIKAHPAFFGFLKKRFETKKFTGFALTVLILIFVYFLYLYLALIFDVLYSRTIVGADLRIDELILVFRHGTLIGPFSWITLLGEWQFVAAASVVFAAFLWLWQKKNYVYSFFVTIVGSVAFGALSKIAIHRPRPTSGLIFESSYSFPSNHAVIALAFFGFIAYFFWRDLKTLRNKLNVFFGCLTLIILIGFSRLYLGVHFLSDVLGGYLLGLLWLLIGIIICEYLNYKTVRLWLPTPKLKKRTLTILSGMLLALIVIFYVLFGIYFKPEINPQTEKNENQLVISSVENISQIFEAAKLPKYSETLTGAKQEPLSFIIISSSESRLIDAFAAADWYLADTPNLTTVSKIVQSGLFNISYPNAPMTPSFWNAEIHDLGFEKPIDLNSVRQRHHARFWKTNITTSGGQSVFVGTASLDISLKWLVVHKIDPGIDTERETVFRDLFNTGAILKFQKEQFVQPLLGKNFAGDQFFTDGEIYVIELK